MNFSEYLLNVNNPEKTRNFSNFKNYSLAEFEDCIKEIGLHKKFSNSKFPLRISIVGTNGKGSVSYILSILAKRSSLFTRIGLFTSPHLIHKEERISISGENITTEKLNFLFNELKNNFPWIFKNLSYFEIFTMMAFYFFNIENCDLEIYEAGLGGRLDATKLAFSEILIVTKIDLDHCEILGDTSEKILKEKLAISTDFTKILFFYDQNNDKLNNLILEYCRIHQIKSFYFDENFTKFDYLEYNLHFCKFIIKKITEEFNFSSKMKAINISPKDITIKGRLEVLRKTPLVIFDVAHNVSATEYLILSLKSKFQIDSLDVLISCLQDKDSIGMIKCLLNEKIIGNIFYYQSEEFSKLFFEDIKIKIIDRKETLKSILNGKKPLLITGSFRMYNLALEILRLDEV